MKGGPADWRGKVLGTGRATRARQDVFRWGARFSSEPDDGVAASRAVDGLEAQGGAAGRAGALDRPWPACDRGARSGAGPLKKGLTTIAEKVSRQFRRAGVIVTRTTGRTRGRPRECNAGNLYACSVLFGLVRAVGKNRPFMAFFRTVKFSNNFEPSSATAVFFARARCPTMPPGRRAGRRADELPQTPLGHPTPTWPRRRPSPAASFRTPHQNATTGQGPAQRPRLSFFILSQNANGALGRRACLYGAQYPGAGAGAQAGAPPCATWIGRRRNAPARGHTAPGRGCDGCCVLPLANPAAPCIASEAGLHPRPITASNLALAWNKKKKKPGFRNANGFGPANICDIDGNSAGTQPSACSAPDLWRGPIPASLDKTANRGPWGPPQVGACYNRHAEAGRDFRPDHKSRVDIDALGSGI